MKIAFQGAAGAYSESGSAAGMAGLETVALDRFEDVFEAVRSGRTSHGILPVENSIGGSIHRNYDLLLEHDLPIVAEAELPVVHNLLSMPGTTLQTVRRVFSHPQALAQCEMFLHTLAGHRDRRHLRHGGQRPDDSRGQPQRHRGDRLVARRRESSA